MDYMPQSYPTPTGGPGLSIPQDQIAGMMGGLQDPLALAGASRDPQPPMSPLVAALLGLMTQGGTIPMDPGQIMAIGQQLSQIGMQGMMPQQPSPGAAPAPPGPPTGGPPPMR